MTTQTDITTDPTAELNAAKLKIEQQIDAANLLLKREQKKLREIEKLSVETISDKPQRLADQEAVMLDLQSKITELEFDLKDLSRSRQDQQQEMIQAALMTVADKYLKQNTSASYIIEDQSFSYVQDYSTVPEKLNVQVRTLEPNKFVEELANELKIKSWHLPVPLLKDLFNQHNRTYQLSRYSINPQIWQRSRVYLPIEHMEKYFIDRVQVDDKPYSEFFDCLMYSLSGGKAENAEHIERWLIHKVLNYRKAVTTPDIVIVGHVGGNGKGILQAMIRLIFPSVLSGLANSKTLNGNFNAIMLGKLIVFFDDQNSTEIPLEVVKQLAGAETMIFERKGKDQYEGEKTHSSAWFSNTLPFKLTPSGKEGGVDRRFSIMRTNITFLESIRQQYAQNHNTEVSVEESKDIAEAAVNQFLLNRTEIARWFRHLCQKHSYIDENYVLKPLHGDDYKYFLERQQNSLDVIWNDLVAPILLTGGCVPVFVIKELLRHMEGKTTGDKTIVTKLNDLAAANRIDVDIERVYISIEPSLIVSKKQCSVIRPKDAKAWTNHSFDWSLVSNQKYNGGVAYGQELIPEQNLVFGSAIDEESEE